MTQEILSTTLREHIIFILHDLKLHGLRKLANNHLANERQSLNLNEVLSSSKVIFRNFDIILRLSPLGCEHFSGQILNLIYLCVPHRAWVTLDAQEMSLVS